MAGLQTRMGIPSSLTAAFRGLSLEKHTVTSATTSTRRCFSTALSLQNKIKPLPEHMPPYPYGPNYTYLEANTGLFGGATIQHGNKISKGRNKGKTRRIWLPNVRRKKLRSDALDQDLFIKVTRKALRTIYKSGGLDNYLLSDSPGRLKELGIFGWKLRWRVMQSPTIREKFQKQRQKLELPAPPSFEQWLEEKKRAEELRLSVEKDVNISDRATTNYSQMPQPKSQPLEDASKTT
jgi:large subunit ribosomal protein L28